eukprot:718664-Pyramimonas_sp.AAC.1
MQDWLCGTHAGGPTGSFGGAPYEATKCCTGWVNMPNRSFWDVSGRSHWGFRGASVELPMGPRNAALGG